MKYDLCALKQPCEHISCLVNVLGGGSRVIRIGGGREFRVDKGEFWGCTGRRCEGVKVCPFCNWLWV